MPALDAGGPARAADLTLVVNQDGLAWTKLTTSVDAVRVADGPAGVIGFGQSIEDFGTRVWMLLEEPAAAPSPS